MIFGRPTNLWLGAFTAVFNVGVLSAAAAGYPLDGVIAAGVNVAAAAVITLIANQPPTINPGDTVHVTTPEGQPNKEISIS
jgi:hypothetical protein